MLEIERGRHVKPQKIPLEQRTCQRCTLNSVDDEIHFLITCSYFATQRTSLLAENKLLSSEFDSLSTQRTRDIDPMLDRCWASVLDGGTTLVQHWVDVSCLLGNDDRFIYIRAYVIYTSTISNMLSKIHLWLFSNLKRVAYLRFIKQLGRRVTGAAGDSSNHPLMSSMLSVDHHCGISDWCGW